jgi:hypothetical protein
MWPITVAPDWTEYHYVRNDKTWDARYYYSYNVYLTPNQYYRKYKLWPWKK